MNYNVPESKIRIGIEKKEIINSYIAETINILNQRYIVDEVPVKKISIIRKIFFKKYDFFIDNWSENLLIDKKGKVNLSRIFIYVCYKIFLKLISKKVIYVKHNVYPHNTAEQDISKVRYLIKKIAFLNDSIVTHSNRIPFNKYSFVPHPLYKFKNKSSDNISMQQDYFVIFGRVLKYKNIEEYIKLCPDDISIIIAGECNDQNYLNKLKSLAKGKDNIKLLTETLTNDDAYKLIKNSKGLIIANENLSSIVSGTFYFGLAVGTNILSLSNPFIDWFDMKYNVDGIYKFSNINSLFAKSKKIKNYRSKNTDKILNKYFSDHAILEHWIKLIEK